MTADTPFGGPNEDRPPSHSGQQRVIGVLRVVFGLVWALNVWFHLHGAYLDNYLAGFQSALQGSPHWLQGWIGGTIVAIEAVGPHTAALISVAVEILIALSLITGWWGRAGMWLGLFYTFLLWSTLGAFGGTFGQGYTDPGVWPPYIIAFIVLLELRAWEVVRLPGGPTPRPAPAPNTVRLPMIGRALFGLLWAFEAFWKWHPYFITHFLGFILPAAVGQPAWIAGYIHGIAAIVKAINPAVAGTLTAIVETLIAVSLLTGRGLRYGLMLGALWSLAIWTTAEGWGGPYGVGFSSSAMTGDIFGNAINYAFIFVLLATAYLPRRHAGTPPPPAGA